MTRYFYYAVTLGFVLAVIPLRAANQPPEETDTQTTMVWTNGDLEKLHSFGLISIVGQNDQEKPKPSPAAGPYVRTQDPEWYSVQAETLRDELERRQTQLREYRQGIDDARSLRKTTGGMNLEEGDFTTSPEVGIEILKRNVREVQMEIGDLEDLARRHGIPPGKLRGQ